jgi:hypothetical protein
MTRALLARISKGAEGFEPVPSEELVERVGIALLNDDRIRNGWPPVESLDGFGDAQAYRSSARAALAMFRAA